MTGTRGLRLYELMQAPESSGIYAWYYRLELSNKDISDCIIACQTASNEERCKIVRTFLTERLFNYYREQPYYVSLTGRLKPTYTGMAENQHTISESLVERIAAEPIRLKRVKELLLQAIPLFASPIYIGIAKNLRNRLLRHKALIEKYEQANSALDINFQDKLDSDPDVERDHSFAKEVAVTRRFATHNLIVHVMELTTDEDIRIDVENLLNRINYPLCGRN